MDVNEIERPFVVGTTRYVAFVDPSGGLSDSMCLSIGHRDKDRIIVDVLREIAAPFDPESATEEFSAVLKSYGLGKVTGNRYAGEWPPRGFRERAIEYTTSEQPKNSLYVDVLPLLNSRSLRPLDIFRLVNQIAALKRRTARKPVTRRHGRSCGFRRPSAARPSHAASRAFALR